MSILDQLNVPSRGSSRRDTGRRGSGGDNSYYQHEYAEPLVFQGYKIMSIILMETGTYNPEYLRPYTASANRKDISAIAEIAHDFNTNTVTPTQIAGIAGRILHFGSEVSKSDLVNVENGWDEKRLSFMIEVVEMDRSALDYDDYGNEVVTTISGYTDRFDLAPLNNSRRGGDAALPSDLTFFVSNVHRVNREGGRILTNNQVIAPAYHELNRYRSDNNLYTIRPMDVFIDKMTADKTPTGAARYNSANKIVGTICKTSRAANLTASSYIASSLNALTHSKASSSGVRNNYGGYDERGGRDPYHDASARLKEDSLKIHNSFFDLLSSRSNEFNSRSTFSWGDLEDIFTEDIQRVVSLYKRKAVRSEGRSRWAERGQSAEWDCNENGGYNAVFATALKQAVPAYALESQIYSCRIEATNIISRSDTFDAINGALINISDVLFVNPIDSAAREDQLIDQLRQNIADNILLDLSLNNELDYDIVAEIDWRNDSFIEVGINGGEMIEFSTAGFSNSLTSPIITADSEFSENLITDLNQIADQILRG